jgi:hypothetical protein
MVVTFCIMKIRIKHLLACGVRSSVKQKEV